MLYQHRSNKDIRKNFFTNRIMNTWNSLPENVIDAKDRKSSNTSYTITGRTRICYTTTNPTSQLEKKLKLMEEKELSVVVDGQRSETDLQV